MTINYEGNDYWKDEVNKIRLFDSISGGAESSLNKSSQDLADRTFWLKNRIAWNDIIFEDGETVAVSTGTKKVYYAPFGLILERVNIQCVSAPTAPVVIDVQVCGNTIFENSDQPTLEIGENVSEVELKTDSYPTSGQDIWEVEKNQRIEFIVDDAGADAEGLKIVLVSRRDFESMATSGCPTSG